MNPMGIDGACKIITLIGSLLSTSPQVNNYQRMAYHEPNSLSIDSHSGEINVSNSHHLIHVTAQTQGYRPKQQDNYFPYHQNQSASLNDQTAFFGVYDGHGKNGNQIAQAVAQRLPFILINKKNFRNDPFQALIDSFHSVQGIINPTIGTESGTTAVVTLFANNKLFVANTGDSRAVLYNDTGEIILKTIDHKPDNEFEKARIEKTGNSVTHFFNDCPRVNGELATSRVIGDFCFGNATPATPDILQHELDGSELFLILASDGLWDTISNEKAFEYIVEYLKKEEVVINNLAPDHLQQAGEYLIKQALNLGSRDNITVTIVYFNHE